MDELADRQTSMRQLMRKEEQLLRGNGLKQAMQTHKLHDIETAVSEVNESERSCLEETKQVSFKESTENQENQEIGDAVNKLDIEEQEDIINLFRDMLEKVKKPSII